MQPCLSNNINIKFLDSAVVDHKKKWAKNAHLNRANQPKRFVQYSRSYRFFHLRQNYIVHAILHRIFRSFQIVLHYHPHQVWSSFHIIDIKYFLFLFVNLICSDRKFYKSGYTLKRQFANNWRSTTSKEINTENSCITWHNHKVKSTRK